MAPTHVDSSGWRCHCVVDRENAWAEDDHGPPAVMSWKTLREGRAGCAEASLLTVEADQNRVDSRLAAGRA